MRILLTNAPRGTKDILPEQIGNWIELENKIHYSTASRTKFINELYMICSKKYYKRIAYLTVNRKSNRYAVIEDIITDSTLLQITGYKTEDGHSYKNVRLIESPDIELRFCFGDDFVFE